MQLFLHMLVVWSSWIPLTLLFLGKRKVSSMQPHTTIPTHKKKQLICQPMQHLRHWKQQVQVIPTLSQKDHAYTVTQSSGDNVPEQSEDMLEFLNRLLVKNGLTKHLNEHESVETPVSTEDGEPIKSTSDTSWYEY